MRRATEVDAAWMLAKAEKRNEWLGLGPFDREHVSDLAGACSCLVNDDGGLIWGMDAPAIGSPDPAINLVIYWDGPSLPLLSAHEGRSPLPSGVYVHEHHERKTALQRALRGRGYAPFETLWIKR